MMVKVCNSSKDWSSVSSVINDMWFPWCFNDAKADIHWCWSVVLLFFSVLGRFLSTKCCENHLAQTAPPQVRNVETESVPCKSKHCQIDPNCAICFTRMPARWKCIPFLPIKSHAVVAWESSWANKLPKTMGPCWILCAVCLPKKHSNIHRSCHMGIDQNLLSQYFRDEDPIYDH